MAFYPVNEGWDTVMQESISIRNAITSDLEAVISLDQLGSKEEKQAYWSGIFDHFVNSHEKDRHFLVAKSNNRVIGFIIGEVRAWEFGSPPCGWVFALAVSENVRAMGIGQLMFEEILRRLKQFGVSTVRTMADRDNKLLLSFFRGMGLSAGRYVELEMELN